MASKGVDTLLELRSQLQEKRATLMRQVEEERRRVARLEQESIQVNCKGILGTRGEYFSIGRDTCPHPTFFSRAVIFKSGCFVQKYWSGTVTRNTVMRRAAHYKIVTIWI